MWDQPVLFWPVLLTHSSSLWLIWLLGLPPLNSLLHTSTTDGLEESQVIGDIYFLWACLEAGKLKNIRTHYEQISFVGKRRTSDRMLRLIWKMALINFLNSYLLSCLFVFGWLMSLGGSFYSLNSIYDLQWNLLRQCFQSVGPALAIMLSLTQIGSHLLLSVLRVDDTSPHCFLICLDLLVLLFFSLKSSAGRCNTSISTSLASAWDHLRETRWGGASFPLMWQ